MKSVVLSQATDKADAFWYHKEPISSCNIIKLEEKKNKTTTTTQQLQLHWQKGQKSVRASLGYRIKAQR